jgi:hypothetical protein
MNPIYCTTETSPFKLERGFQKHVRYTLVSENGNRKMENGKGSAGRGKPGDLSLSPLSSSWVLSPLLPIRSSGRDTPPNHRLRARRVMMKRRKR